jgi:hypothetical protein
MRFAYADPPYLMQCEQYGHRHEMGPWFAGNYCWDKLATHRDLIQWLSEAFPDGWALSASSPSLQQLLPICPSDVRVAAWVKPFAAFKRNVRNAYTWEPVILRGGRRSSLDGAPVTRDHLAESITLKRGLTGAKPEKFCRWVLDMLGYKDGDALVDLFPGTAVMSAVLAQAGFAVKGT